jgi:hypothetical protein
VKQFRPAPVGWPEGFEQELHPAGHPFTSMQTQNQEQAEGKSMQARKSPHTAGFWACSLRDFQRSP